MSGIIYPERIGRIRYEREGRFPPAWGNECTGIILYVAIRDR